MHAADINGDGLVDLVSATGSPKKLYWYANGGGSPVSWTFFEIPTVISSGGVPWSMLVADVDGDARNDVGYCLTVALIRLASTCLGWGQFGTRALDLHIDSGAPSYAATYAPLTECVSQPHRCYSLRFSEFGHW